MLFMDDQNCIIVSFKVIKTIFSMYHLDQLKFTHSIVFNAWKPSNGINYSFAKLPTYHFQFFVSHYCHADDPILIMKSFITIGFKEEWTVFLFYTMILHKHQLKYMVMTQQLFNPNHTSDGWTLGEGPWYWFLINASTSHN